MGEPGIAGGDPGQEQLPAITIVEVGGMDPDRQDQAQGVYQQMPLASVDPLGAVIAPDPPFSVVRTD
jgi:hypothetical protein